MNGFYLRLPQEREAWVELRSNWVGFGITRFPQDTEVFLGLFQVTISEQRLGRAVRGRRRRMVVAAAFTAALLVPSPIRVLADQLHWTEQAVPSYAAQH